VAIAIVAIVYMNTKIYIVRTRDPIKLSKLNFVVDIGGGAFDHHMAGFNKRRPTGEKYASAGLVWQKYGEWAIKKVMAENSISIDDDDIKTVKEMIDRNTIIPVDLEDNGEKNSTHEFSFISKFLPSWMEKEPDYDGAFLRVEKIAYDILKEIIRDALVKVVAKKELEKRYNNIKDGILEIPAQTMPWLEDVISYNQNNDFSVKFVICPYPAGGWAAQCVPPSMERKFDQIVSFPKEWAGRNENTLPNISGVKDSTFCHNGCFFARAKTKDAITEMCKLAIKQ
jgi:uncharacterized UPF0160 family protein